MRKLMWFAVGFGTACLLGAYWLSTTALLMAGVCTLAMAVGGLLLFSGISHGRRGAIVCLGLAVGMLWFSAFSYLTLRPLEELDGEVRGMTFEVTDYSYLTGYGTAADASCTIAGLDRSVRVYLNETVELQPGDRVSGSFRLSFMGKGGTDSVSYFSGAGVFLLCNGIGDVSIERAEGSALRHFPARARYKLSQQVDAIFPEDTASFAKALLLGDRSDLSYSDTTALTLSGIIHLVSVSGLHVSAISAALYFLLGRRRFLTPFVGIGVLFLVAAITGFSPSVVRACLMYGLVLLALLFNRQSDGPTALAFAVIVMLTANPYSASSIGLQMSVASVIGIQAFALPISDYIHSWRIWGDVRSPSRKARVCKFLSGSISVSLSAAITTAPLTAIHYGTVSLVGIVTNLLSVSVASVLFCMTIVAVGLSFVWLSGAQALGWCLGWLIRYILRVARLLSGFPLAAVYTQSIYIVVWLLCTYILLGLFLLLRRKKVWQLFVSVTVLLAAALVFSCAEPRMDSYRITVLDVGQGQCVLLQSGGRTYMVDCGGDGDTSTADKAANYLCGQGVFRLDGLILTHYDSDHVGAARYLLERIPADTLYLPVGPGSEEWMRELPDRFQSRILWLEEDLKLTWDGADLQLLTSKNVESSNESSLCVLFQKENYDILITGDRTQMGEIDLLSCCRIPQLDALVVGHHGSDSSTSEFLLRQTRPTTAIISVGAGNGYGHPDSQVLERLESFGCVIRRTDREGTIIIRG